MELSEFEAQSRDVIERSLNQLQTATSLMAELENQLSLAGRTVQELGQLIETFVQSQDSTPD